MAETPPRASRGSGGGRPTSPRRRGSFPQEPPPPTAEIAATLTPRELQVLELIAEGLTNPQIGQRLFISPKTASVHVSAILAKVGAANRAEAAALLRRLRRRHPPEPADAAARGIHPLLVSVPLVSSPSSLSPCSSPSPPFVSSPSFVAATPRARAFDGDEPRTGARRRAGSRRRRCTAGWVHAVRDPRADAREVRSRRARPREDARRPQLRAEVGRLPGAHLVGRRERRDRLSRREAADPLLPRARRGVRAPAPRAVPDRRRDRRAEGRGRRAARSTGTR